MTTRQVRLILTILVTLTAAGIIRAVTNRSPRPAYEYVVASRGDISQQVTVTGTVRAAEQVQLAFEVGGKVARVNVEVGATVRRGTLLVSLDQAQLLANRRQAQAGVASARALYEQGNAALQTEREKLAELQRGSRPEERRIREAALDQAEQDLANEHAAVPDTTRDAYTRADEAVRVKTVGLFNGTAANGYQLTYTACDIQAEQAATFHRRLAEEALRRWRGELDTLTLGAASDVDAALDRAAAHLTVIADFLERTTATLHTGCAREDATLDSPRANLATAQSSLVAAFNLVSQQRQAIAAERAAVERVRRELELTAAGTSVELLAQQAAVVRQAEAQLKAHAARVEEAEAMVASAQAQLQQRQLRAPFNGLVSEVATRVGEIVSPGAPVVTLLSTGAYEIAVNVPEVDAAKLAVGQTARVTLDAYGDDVEFTATVAEIDPAATAIEGVPTFQATLQLPEADERLRAGLTADVEIHIARRQEVIVVPQRAVRERRGERFVQILSPGDGRTPTVLEVPVRVGLKGSDGNVEIAAGLSGGERVIISP